MSIAERVLHRRPPMEARAVCPADHFEFSPRFTDGKCPLCGWLPFGGPVTLPWSARIDRFWVMLGALALVSIAMSVLVVLAYMRH